MNWIDTAVAYQVNLRSLAAREPRNAVEAARETPPDASPLGYLSSHLDVIGELGVTLLYLMPVYPIGLEARKGIGSPYAIRDFLSVDPEFGTVDELRALVRTAHRRDLRVILDITPNHTSRDHVWTREHPEYYLKTASGELYHDYDWWDVAKLDYRNRDLRRAMAAVYDAWLGDEGMGGGVDGFRLDMAHVINDLGFWDEVLPKLRARHAPRELLFMAESYGTRNNLDLFTRGMDAAYDDDFYKACVYLYAIDEAGRSVVSLAAEAEGNADFADKLAAFKRGGIAGAFECALLNYERRGCGGGGLRLARYVDNHDEGRGLYRFGEGAVRAVMQLVFLSPRTVPLLLTGQEFGALNRPPIHERFALCDKGPRRVADGRVRHEAGIELEGNVFARTLEQRRGWYGFYRDLIGLRARTPELMQGAFTLVDVGEDCRSADRAVIAFERALAGSRVVCAVNLGPEPRTLRQGEVLAGDALYGGMDGERLAPFSAVVVRKRQPSPGFVPRWRN